MAACRDPCLRMYILRGVCGGGSAAHCGGVCGGGSAAGLLVSRPCPDQNLSKSGLRRVCGGGLRRVSLHWGFLGPSLSLSLPPSLLLSPLRRGSAAYIYIYIYIYIGFRVLSGGVCGTPCGVVYAAIPIKLFAAGVCGAYIYIYIYILACVPGGGLHTSVSGSYPGMRRAAI